MVLPMSGAQLGTQRYGDTGFKSSPKLSTTLYWHLNSKMTAAGPKAKPAATSSSSSSTQGPQLGTDRQREAAAGLTPSDRPIGTVVDGAPAVSNQHEEGISCVRLYTSGRLYHIQVLFSHIF